MFRLDLLLFTLDADLLEVGIGLLFADRRV